jgi:hypothetical protein
MARNVIYCHLSRLIRRSWVARTSSGFRTRACTLQLSRFGQIAPPGSFGAAESPKDLAGFKRKLREWFGSRGLWHPTGVHPERPTGNVRLQAMTYPDEILAGLQHVGTEVPSGAYSIGDERLSVPVAERAAPVRRPQLVPGRLRASIRIDVAYLYSGMDYRGFLRRDQNLEVLDGEKHVHRKPKDTQRL